MNNLALINRPLVSNPALLPLVIDQVLQNDATEIVFAPLDIFSDKGYTLEVEVIGAGNISIYPNSDIDNAAVIFVADGTTLQTINIAFINNTFVAKCDDISVEIPATTITAIKLLGSFTAGSKFRIFSLVNQYNTRGPAGSILHTTILDPQNTVGNDGDYAIDAVMGLIYGPKANGIWPDAISFKGVPGPAGSSIIRLDSEPNSTDGNNGDYAFNPTTGNLYGPKEDDSWPEPVSLIGPRGNTIHKTTGIPSAFLGINGDYAYDPVSKTFYGPKAYGGWPQGSVIAGATGATGARGSAVLTINGTPTDDDGLNGDYCYDPNTYMMYGPKTNGQWPTGHSLEGGSNALLTTTGIPDSLLGVNGDYAYDPAERIMYGPKAAGIWPAGITLIGNTGPSGNTILPTNGLPSVLLGIEGDYALDINAVTIYGPKTAGGWPDGISLAGGGANTILTTSGIPDNATGINGDYAYDPVLEKMYGPKTAGVWADGTSIHGATGAAGRTILSVSAVPSAGLGSDGDYAYDAASKIMYGPKAGTWPVGISLTGPQGPSGNTILKVNGVPGGGFGAVGDYAIDPNALLLYGPKEAGGWPAGVSLAGGGANTIRSTSGAPSGALGINGDFAYDITTSLMYGPKAAGAWPAGISIKGLNGTNGTNGNTVLTTSGAPSNAVGVNGDYAYDPTLKRMYGPKAGGTWPASVLIGANTILTTLTTPSGGNNGDYCYNPITKTMYGPKADGNWPAGVTLNGNTILTTNGAPTSGFGVVGNYAYDPATKTMYGPKTLNSWPAGVVLAGAAGENGNTILNVVGAPADVIGKNGDLAYDPNAIVMYGPKAGGVWPAGVSLKGTGTNSSFLTTDGAPSGLLGVNGDYAYDPITKLIYGPKADSVWPAGQVLGTSGNGILTTSGAPLNTFGGNGDYAYDPATKIIYGPKTAGIWPPGILLGGGGGGILTTDGVPASGFGDNGSYAYDPTTRKMYGPKANGTWPEGVTLGGGGGLLTTVGVPSSALGIDGDYAYDNVTRAMYGPKAAGVWPEGRILGADGADGANGLNGNTILTVTGAPSNGIGANGDYAYNPTANVMYGPKVNGVWPAGRLFAGLNGTNGTNGNTIITTSGQPVNGAGVNGDYAYDPVAKIMYGPKANGVWSAGTALVGTAGASGNTIITTVDAPSNGVGNNGDYAYSPSANIMYGPKAAGVWPAGVPFAGINGVNGTNGNTILTVTDAPLNSLGSNGDYAYSPSTNMMYGPKAAGVWPTGVLFAGLNGIDGVDGTNGNTILTCSGVPAVGVGVNGDYAYDPATKIIYGPKAAGVWPAGTSLMGPQGIAGNTVLTTSGAPAGGTGVNGDYAYDATAKVMYGPKAGGIWPAGVSIAGTQGLAGNTILTVAAVPATGIGVNGDYAYNPATFTIYGPKASGTWPAGISILGAAGNTILTTSGIPNNGVGVNGNYAYDPTTRTMYGPKVAGTWPAGIALNGVNGNTIRTTDGDPSNSVGVNGDYAYDPATKIIYGPKAGGAWPTGLAFAGADGNTILTVSGVPSNLTGKDGDYAYDPATKIIYGPKASDVWPAGIAFAGTDGTNGLDGADGADGKTVLTTAGIPSNVIGIDGDYAIDPNTQIIYGPKNAGIWPAGVNLKGSNGNTLLTTAGVPDNASGANGDYAYDPATNILYGPKAAGIWPAGVLLKGEPGTDGIDGIDGIDGANGNTILTTTGVPAPGIGANGDYAYDPIANIMYGPKAENIWPAGIPFAGINGTDGHTILSTSGAPSVGDGNDGDLAWDSAAKTMYGPKAAGVWPAGITLSGTNGNTILTVSGVPGVELGVNGDYAYDPASKVFYGPKAAGVWPEGITFGGEGSASGGLAVVIKTTADDATVLTTLTTVYADSSAGPFTLKLPASPAVGDHIQIVDAKNSFPNYNLTLLRNGNTISGLQEDLVLDTSNILDLYYQDELFGWHIVISNMAAVGPVQSLPYLNNIVQQVVTTSDCNKIDFTGLSSLADGEYILSGAFIGVNGAAALDISLLVNGDLTLSNYRQSYAGTAYNDSVVCTIQSDYTTILQCKIVLINGKCHILGSSGRQNAATTVTNVQFTNLYTVGITDINSLTLKLAGATTGIKAGSSISLYRSNSFQEVVAYGPIDITSRSSDYPLKAGETVTRSFTNALSVPLNIATVAGVYELTLVRVGAAEGSSSNTVLNPNNTTYTNLFRAPGSSPGAGNPSAFILANCTIRKGSFSISTEPANKVLTGLAVGNNASAYASYSPIYTWEDAVIWTSLGTLVFPVSQSGKVIVKRIL